MNRSAVPTRLRRQGHATYPGGLTIPQSILIRADRVVQ